MQNDNVKFKIILLFLSLFFLSGCVKNVNLRQQAREEKAQEQKSISSMQGAVDLGEEKSNQLPESNDAEKKPIKVLFVGDMMFDRHIREAVEKYGRGDYNYILEPIKEKLSEYDLVIGNLEGPITDAKSVSMNTKLGESKNFVFTFDPVVAKVLAENNIKLVNLGNNHILNQGAKGVEQTKKYLDEAGMEYFGDTGLGDENFFVREIREIKIGFVNYNYSVSGLAEEIIKDFQNGK